METRNDPRHSAPPARLPADDLFPANFTVTQQAFTGQPTSTIVDYQQPALGAKSDPKKDPFRRKPETPGQIRLAREVIIPGVLFLLAWGGYSAYAWWFPQRDGPLTFDPAAFIRLQGMLGMYLLLNTAVTTFIALVAAPLAGVAPGSWARCLVRMAAVTAFPWAVAQVIPFPDYVIRPLLAIILIDWLFDLDFSESYMWAFIITLIQLALNFTLLLAGMSLAYHAI